MPLNLAKDAAEISRATRLEEWCRAHPELWPELRKHGWFTETLDRIGAPPLEEPAE